ARDAFGIVRDLGRQGGPEVALDILELISGLLAPGLPAKLSAVQRDRFVGRQRHAVLLFLSVARTSLCARKSIASFSALSMFAWIITRDVSPSNSDASRGAIDITRALLVRIKSAISLSTSSIATRSARSRASSISRRSALARRRRNRSSRSPAKILPPSSRFARFSTSAWR